MDVILREKIENLGDEGQIVKVRPGYARNFLIPKGYAFVASSTNAAQLEHQKRVALEQRRRKIKTEEDLARALTEIGITVSARAGEGNRIFGSVTSKDLAAALGKRGFNVDRRKIYLDEPIRSLGEYEVPVRLSGDISSQIKVNVVAE